MDATASVASATDAVCGMDVDPRTAMVVEYRGHSYFFCESACADLFRDEPERWIPEDRHDAVAAS